MGLVFLLLLGLGVLVTLRLSQQPLRSKGWMLLRSLLPSWRFFDEVEPGPALCFRVAPPVGDYGPWREAIAPRVGFGALLFNAQGNLRLSYQSLVEQLEAELDGLQLEAALQLVTYRLVQRLVEEQATTLAPRAAGHRYQFRIGDDDGFVSPEHVL